MFFFHLSHVVFGTKQNTSMFVVVTMATNRYCNPKQGTRVPLHIHNDECSRINVSVKY